MSDVPESQWSVRVWDNMSEPALLAVRVDVKLTPSDLLDLAEELRQAALSHGGPRTREYDLKRGLGADAVTVHDDGSWSATLGLDRRAIRSADTTASGHRVVIVGDPFSDDSPRRRAARRNKEPT